jgi:hypothetical protein
MTKIKTRNMKLLLSAVAAAALMMSAPAFAQGGRVKLHEGRDSAYFPHSRTTQFNPYHDSNAVFVGGTYAGSDPDPNVRAALIREFGRRGM